MSNKNNRKFKDDSKPDYLDYKSKKKTGKPKRGGKREFKD